jgi:thiamine-monophosphate kinase
MREFELLQHIFRSIGRPSLQVPIPPGDDMAMLRLSGVELLAAVDQVVGGRHVDTRSTPPELIGRKAVARCLSDVAAMAARPVGALAAVTLPPDFGQERAEALFDGLLEAARRFGCPVVGGDIAFHGDLGAPLVCSVTVLAEPGPAGAVTRGGARPGDVVYVTGALGGSYQPGGGGRHLSFDPRIEEALELARQLEARLHAMIDLSDGLGRDAAHVAEQSGVQIKLEAGRIPCAAGADWQAAMSDGEDYELCFTATGVVPRKLGAVAVTPVGSVLKRPGPGSPLVVVDTGRELVDGSQMGWEHHS